MLIDTIRFGQVEVDPAKVLTFDEGLPGLEEYHAFSILQFEAGNPIFWLQSTTDPGVSLPVVDSFSVWPGYAFDLSEEDIAALAIQSQKDLYVLSVLVIPEPIHGMTINLAAPILINLDTGRARQIILGGGEWGVRTPVFARICELLKEGEGHAGAQSEDQ